MGKIKQDGQDARVKSNYEGLNCFLVCLQSNLHASV